MKCREMREHLSAYLDGELEKDLAAQVAAHLEGCEACRAELQALREIAGMLHALPKHAAPEEMEREVLAYIERDMLLGAAPVAPARPRFAAMRLAGLAAAALLVVVGAVMFVATQFGGEPMATAPTENNEIAAAKTSGPDANGRENYAMKVPDASGEDADRILKKDITLGREGDLAKGATDDLTTQRYQTQAQVAQARPAAQPAAPEGQVAVARDEADKLMKTRGTAAAPAAPLTPAPATEPSMDHGLKLGKGMESLTKSIAGGRPATETKSGGDSASNVAIARMLRQEGAAEKALKEQAAAPAEPEIYDLVLAAEDVEAARRQLAAVADDLKLRTMIEGVQAQVLYTVPTPPAGQNQIAEGSRRAIGAEATPARRSGEQGAVNAKLGALYDTSTLRGTPVMTLVVEEDKYPELIARLMKSQMKPEASYRTRKYVIVNDRMVEAAEAGRVTVTLEAADRQREAEELTQAVAGTAARDDADRSKLGDGAARTALGVEESKSKLAEEKVEELKRANAPADTAGGERIAQAEADALRQKKDNVATGIQAGGAGGAGAAAPRVMARAEDGKQTEAQPADEHARKTETWQAQAPAEAEQAPPPGISQQAAPRLVYLRIFLNTPANAAAQQAAPAAKPTTP